MHLRKDKKWHLLTTGEQFYDKWNVQKKIFLQLEAVLPGYQSNQELRY